MRHTRRKPGGICRPRQTRPSPCTKPSQVRCVYIPVSVGINIPHANPTFQLPSRWRSRISGHCAGCNSKIALAIRSVCYLVPNVSIAGRPLTLFAQLIRIVLTQPVIDSSARLTPSDHSRLRSKGATTADGHRLHRQVTVCAPFEPFSRVKMLTLC